MANEIPTQPMGTEYAGVWRRSALLLIDAFLLFLALLAMLGAFSAAGARGLARGARRRLSRRRTRTNRGHLP